MSDVWKKREVWIFLCLIIVVNSLFIAGINSKILPFHLYNVGRFLLLGLTLTTVVSIIRGPAGLRELVRSLSVWRVNPLWYLLALLWAPSLAVLFLTAKSLVTGANAFEAVSYGLALRPSIMRTVVIASFVGEIVWVAYSINTLSKRFGTLGGALIVGGFWTLWWVPMALFGKGILPELPILPLFVSMLGIATMCGFVYLSSRSGPVVLSLQIMVNTSLLVFPVVPTNGGHLTYLAFGATYLLASLTLFILYGPRPLFGRLPEGAGGEAAEVAIAA
jgi:membrane protease YdiL (CAAX protease family)